jgi:hypothetical protein
MLKQAIRKNYAMHIITKQKPKSTKESMTKPLFYPKRQRI